MTETTIDTHRSNPFTEVQRQRHADAATGTYRNIRYEVAGGRATVTIDRPHVYNCFDYLTLLELSDALHDAGRDTSVFAVVLTGAGDKAFCTGADLKEQGSIMAHTPQLYHTWMGAFIDVHERLRQIGKPTIARVNGMAVGGGNEFQMACDLSIAADHAYFRHVGPRHGSVPAGGATQWLTIFIGERKAREMVWLGENVEAAKALDWGLINTGGPAAERDAAVDDYVARLGQTLPETIRYTRVQTNFWKDFSWYQTIWHARDWLTVHTAAPEVGEAVAAFNEKRQPDFDGVHDRFGTPAGSYGWGPDSKACQACGTTGLPAGFSHCGNCGAEL
jgi:enoyl-CoA hydratase/carnithine racemase